MFRYTFYYENKEKITLSHFVKTDYKLDEHKQEILRQILANFPHCVDNQWPEKFSQFKDELYDKEILSIAANSYDSSRNTVLGVACQRGEPIEAVKRLIKMGAILDTLIDSKSALHWAITNNLSQDKPNSYEAAMVVKCLLDNGAKTNIISYQDLTPLKYARSRKYPAATRLIAKHIQDKTQAYYRGSMFGLFKHHLPKKICTHLSEFIIENPTDLAVNKDVYKNAKEEIKSLYGFKG